MKIQTVDDMYKRLGIKLDANINKSINDWVLVEIYRVMHNGDLPTNDYTISWVYDFLAKHIKNHRYAGMFSTAYRALYVHRKAILFELIERQKRGIVL